VLTQLAHHPEIQAKVCCRETRALGHSTLVPCKPINETIFKIWYAARSKCQLSYQLCTLRCWTKCGKFPRIRSLCISISLLIAVYHRIGELCEWQVKG
jgi:hypothetical protein